MKKVSCPGCGSNSYVVVSRNKLKYPIHGLIVVELRQCNSCAKRYKVGSNSLAEFYV